MPEGPEIKRLADALEKQVSGRVIDRIFFGLDSLKKWEERLIGCRIKCVETRGKAMLTHLDMGRHEDLTIYSHNQLYGRWIFCNADEYPESKRQLRMAIDCQGKSALLYSASDIAVLNSQELKQHPFLRKLGPDVLSKSTTAEHVIDRLASVKYRNRQLGGVLTEQSFVAGLGNYLRCEILFYSGVHPKARSSDLTNEQLCFLVNAILELTRQSYQTGGITNQLEHAQRLMRQGESFEDARFYIFRRQGLNCYRCGGLIEKITQAGQACYCCLQCQKK